MTAMTVFLAVLTGTAAVSDAHIPDPELGRRRADRAAAMRAVCRSADKASPATFSLLVIPVDFQDQRLPATWSRRSDLDPVLSSNPVSLVDYFNTASRGLLDLRLTVVAPVHLTGTRTDYADATPIPYRARELVREALIATREAGIDFRYLDNDGADGLAGSLDDDGRVDGVLVLHAGVGRVLDPENGLIAPHSYYLETPVIDDGVAAADYALASLQDGLGIWLHETAHLFGLEDRYDPFLSPGGDALSGSGGLGLFSLMSAGAWGTGGGVNPSLPDAYSTLQLGWATVRDLEGTDGIQNVLAPVLQSGVVWKLPVMDNVNEYFLLECRQPLASRNYDAVLSSPQLLVYHVDETIPDDWQSSSDPQNRHLRVALLEADGNQSLARGEDPGSLDDVFPGALGSTVAGPGNTVSTNGYQGETGPMISGIRSAPDGMHLSWSAPGWPYEVSLLFDQTDPPRFSVSIGGKGTLTQPQVTVSLPDPSHAWGTFADGPSVFLSLSSTDGGISWRNPEPQTWLPDPATPGGAATLIRLTVTMDEETRIVDRTWYWRTDAEDLDYRAVWPGNWIVEDTASEGTLWQRWTFPVADHFSAGSYLVCTGSGNAPADWPEVTYGNHALTHLTSPPFRPQGRVLRLLHAIGTHVYESGRPTDGGRVEYQDRSGEWRLLTPRDGYPATLLSTVDNPDAGDACFGGPMELDGLLRPRWRESFFVFPDDVGDSWTRIRFRFSADGLFRDIGWVIADVDLVASAAAADWTPRWQAADRQLTWSWPDREIDGYLLEARTDVLAAWETRWTDTPRVVTGQDMSLAAEYWELTDTGPWDRYTVRLRLATPLGDVLTPEIAVSRSREAVAPLQLSVQDGLAGNFDLRLSVHVDSRCQDATLSVYNLRGRRLRQWHMPVGTTLHLWDGRDETGRRIPSGPILFALSGGGRQVTRKAVLLR